MSHFMPKILPEPPQDTVYRKERLSKLMSVATSFNAWFCNHYAQ